MKKFLLFVIMLSMITFFRMPVFAENEEIIEEIEVLVEQDDNSEKNIIPLEEEKIEQTEIVMPSQARGIHLTTRAAASSYHKPRIDDLLDNTELNTVVIDVKEIDGEISIKGVAKDLAYSSKLPSVEKYLKEVKNRGFYTVARIVVFRDNVMPRKRPDLAVKNPDGTLWEDYKGNTWLNPYKQGTIDYILELSEKSAAMGFDEIQFDYIRFPSDGRTKQCRYGVNHSSTTASAAIVNFLKQAKEKLSISGIKTSIDVFGLTTTDMSGMGIGQRIVEMAKYVDYVSPMIYPSHYNNGEYGIPNPNKEPYRTVYIALQGAKKRIPAEKLRPWLQDFSMKGVKYGPEEIKAQIQACYDCDVKTWMLWNAACKYTKDGLKTKEEQDTYKKTSAEKIDELLQHKTVEESVLKRAPLKPATSANTNTATTKQSQPKTGTVNKQK
mgnify:CR=1 FL=1